MTRSFLTVLGAVAALAVLTAAGCPSERAPAGGAAGTRVEMSAHEDAGLPPGPTPPVREATGEAVPPDEKAGLEEPLAAEKAEAEPESPNVKLKVTTEPPGVRAWVFWGRKKLGKAPVTFQRPRRSGPVDVLVKAEGYLDYHTRLYTDRDDALLVSLVHPDQANTLLGFKHLPDGGVPDGGAFPRPRADAGVPAQARPDAGPRLP